MASATGWKRAELEPAGKLAVAPHACVIPDRANGRGAAQLEKIRMKSINWFEIPAGDLERAVQFDTRVTVDTEGNRVGMHSGETA